MKKKKVEGEEEEEEGEEGEEGEEEKKKNRVGRKFWKRDERGVFMSSRALKKRKGNLMPKTFESRTMKKKNRSEAQHN